MVIIMNFFFLYNKKKISYTLRLTNDRAQMCKPCQPYEPSLQPSYLTQPQQYAQNCNQDCTLFSCIGQTTEGWSLTPCSGHDNYLVSPPCIKFFILIN